MPLRILLILVLLLMSVLSLFLGVIDLSVDQILQGDFETLEILFISRLPRLLAILCTGMGMSVAGLIMQQLCSNKFVSPSTGATISSAQLGILMALLFLPSSTIVSRTLISSAFAILGTWLFVGFTQRVPLKEPVMVPLIGIMFGQIIGGITSFFAFTYGMNQSLSTWLTGSFALIIRGRYELVYLVLPMVVIALIYSNHFNIVGMGHDFANNLGLNYRRVMFLGLSITSIITASIVTVVGSISYIGLIVPNLMSMFKGDRIRGTLVDTALFGALFVLVCDMVGRVLIAPYELPIGLVIGIVGSIIFILLLLIRMGVSPLKRKIPILSKDVNQEVKHETLS